MGKKIRNIGIPLSICTGLMYIANMLLVHDVGLQGSVLTDVAELGACSAANETLYELEYDNILLDDDVIDQWAEQYHETIKTIVEDQLDPEQFTPECDAEKFSDFLEPTDSMKEAIDSLDFLANNSDTDTFSRLDVGLVLLELLRSYECALQERSYFLLKEISTEMARQKVLDGAGIADATKPILIDIGEANEEYIDQQNKILKELAVARPALERTIRIINGRERTKVLKAEIECLQRASLDIRNASALSAEANSCLPRVWNSRDALRDYNER